MEEETPTVVVSYCWGRPCLILVNLEGLSLPRNSATINWPAWHDLVVDWAIKLQHKQTKHGERLVSGNFLALCGGHGYKWQVHYKWCKSGHCLYMLCTCISVVKIFGIEMNGKWIYLNLYLKRKLEKFLVGGNWVVVQTFHIVLFVCPLSCFSTRWKVSWIDIIQVTSRENLSLRVVISFDTTRPA